MYYQERIIAGTYCYKNNPTDDWKPISNEQLTKKIIELQNKNSLLEEKLERAKEKASKKVDA